MGKKKKKTYPLLHLLWIFECDLKIGIIKHDHDTISDMILTVDFNISSSSDVHKFLKVMSSIDMIIIFFHLCKEISS